MSARAVASGPRAAPNPGLWRALWRPEHLGFVLAALAAASMVVHAAASRGLACCAGRPGLAEDLGLWLLMVVAMMVPTLGPSLRDVALRSYRSRRRRAVLACLVGYLASWAAAGLAVLGLRQVVPMELDAHAATAFAAVGVLWAFVPARERWHLLCHRRIVMAPVGLRADVDAARQGVANGWPCVATCWPSMIACTFSGHWLVLMLGGAAILAVEKRMFTFRAAPIALGSALLTAATLARW